MAKGSKMKTTPVKRTTKKDTVTTSKGTGRQSTLSPSMQALADKRRKEAAKRAAKEKALKRGY